MSQLFGFVPKYISPIFTLDSLTLTLDKVTFYQTAFVLHLSLLHIQCCFLDGNHTVCNDRKLSKLCGMLHILISSSTVWYPSNGKKWDGKEEIPQLTSGLSLGISVTYALGLSYVCLYPSRCCFSGI